MGSKPTHCYAQNHIRNHRSRAPPAGRGLRRIRQARETLIKYPRLRVSRSRTCKARSERNTGCIGEDRYAAGAAARNSRRARRTGALDCVALLGNGTTIARETRLARTPVRHAEAWILNQSLPSLADSTKPAAGRWHAAAVIPYVNLGVAVGRLTVHAESSIAPICRRHGAGVAADCGHRARCRRAAAHPA